MPREGLHTATRHELDWPLQLGPVKLVPYGAGELYQAGEGIAGPELTRALGQAGLRASLHIWAVNPA